MKNPFIAMALMAAVLQENARRSIKGYNQRGLTHRTCIPGKRNPAGTKIAKKFLKQTGHAWKDEIVHTGELTRLNKNRALERQGFMAIRP